MSQLPDLTTNNLNTDPMDLSGLNLDDRRSSSRSANRPQAFAQTRLDHQKKRTRLGASGKQFLSEAEKQVKKLLYIMMNRKENGYNDEDIKQGKHIIVRRVS